jgi:hypothetical protein
MTDSQAYALIGEFIESHQAHTYSEIGRQLGLSRNQVARIARRRGIKRRPGNRAALQAAVAAIEAASPKLGCGSAGEAPIPPMEETISTAPDAPPVEETLAPTPETPPAEIAVA